MKKSSSQQRREKEQRKKERAMLLVKKQKTINIIIWSCLVAVVVAALVVAAVFAIPVIRKYFSNSDDSNVLNKVVVQSKYYNFTLGDMQYLFYDNYNDFMSENSENVNIDIEKSLREQYSDSENNVSWYDYFLQQAKENAESFILLASAAKDEGYKLTEKEKKEIDELITAFKEYGAEEGYTLEGYIEYAYGKGITEKNVRHCQEIKKLATRYYTEKVDERILDFSDDDYIKFLEENFDNYAGQTCMVDYTYFSFEAQIEEGATEEEKETSRDNAYKLAEELKNSGSEEAFDEIILKYIETAKLAEESGRTPEEYFKDIYKSSMYYNENDDFAKWAFADDRKTGDTTIIEIKENVFVTYYINKSIYFDEKPTKNFRQILLETENYSSADAAKKTALNIISEWETGAATEDSFKEFVKQYSTDTSSVENGGLYMYVREGELQLDHFDEWLFDEKRKPCDIGLVKSDSAYHVLFFCGEGVPAWQASLIPAIQETVYEELKVPFREKYAVTFEDTLLTKIVG